MPKSTKVIAKKPSRPVPGSDSPVALRLPPDLLVEIDTWAATSAGGLSRPAAIRRLIEKGLAGARPLPGRKAAAEKAAAAASEIAARTIDSIVDKSAPDQEREKRKRRLLKGPEEFRDIRADLPKPKC